MTEPAPPRTSFFSTELFASDTSMSRLGWLIRLRWIAMGGVGVVILMVFAGAFPGVNVKVLFVTALVGSVYNVILWWRQRHTQGRMSRNTAMGQALFDMVLLTFVLWGAGGVRTPFVSYFVFHVALVGILAGARATIFATLGALVCVGALLLTDIVPSLRIAVWNPRTPWQHISDAVAFITTVGAVAYIVIHAMRELRARGNALLIAQERTALEYELLSTTLSQIDAGLEVVDVDGTIPWRNKRAEELAPLSPTHKWQCPRDSGLHPCERDATGVCPVHDALASHANGRCRFAATIAGGERVYERLAFPLTRSRDGAMRVMNLYLDRSSETLAERQLVIAERLASLGRVAQGVAHELNTPLATIRTLATDMRAALEMVRSAETTHREKLVEDIDESATLIQDETRRLGRITQALLAGGDLVRPQLDGPVRLSSVVERARALVFAGVRSGPAIHIAPDLDSLRVVADSDRLVQVIVNLLQNAFDAVRGRAVASVSVSAAVENEHVVIYVDDDGPGIDETIARRLFEPFATTKPPGQGTGLGLYTSYMLVRAMNGSLTLRTREEGGTRATVLLPSAAMQSKVRLPVTPQTPGGAP